MRHRARQLERGTFDDIKQDIGEDPARFLDHDLISDRDMRELAFARIRGIDFQHVIDAWVDVEVALERGPRKPVIAALNERKRELQRIGDRDERVEQMRRQRSQNRECAHAGAVETETDTEEAANV